MSPPETAPLLVKKPRPDQSINQAQAAVNRAKELLGLPWIHQGRNPALGLDCAGLAVECGLAAGLPVEVPADYSRVVDPAILIENILKYCEEVPVTDIQAGDLMLMHCNEVPQHLGIYIGDDWFIHSYIKHGIAQQQLIPFWRNRITHVFRIV